MRGEFSGEKPGAKIYRAFSSPDVEFIDAAGAKVRPPRKGSAFSLEITDSPLYFIGGELRDSF